MSKREYQVKVGKCSVLITNDGDKAFELFKRGWNDGWDNSKPVVQLITTFKGDGK